MFEDDQYAREQAEVAAREAGAIGGSPGEGASSDPARRPVEEAGGGEAEGFEQAEAALVQRAEHGEGGSPELDAFAPEAEADRSGAEYGEADEVDATARREDREDAAPGA